MSRCLHSSPKLSKSLRNHGLVPAVLYGGRHESVSLSVNPALLEKALKTDFGKNQILDLAITNGSKAETCRALAYVISRDAVSQKIIHVDFFRVEKETKVRVSVPVKVLGVAPGVKKGGVFLNRLKQVKIDDVVLGNNVCIIEPVNLYGCNEFFQLPSICFFKSNSIIHISC